MGSHVGRPVEFQLLIKTFPFYKGETDTLTNAKTAGKKS